MKTSFRRSSFSFWRAILIGNVKLIGVFIKIINNIVKVIYVRPSIYREIFFSLRGNFVIIKENSAKA